MHLGTPPTLLSRAPLRPYGLFGTFCYDPDPENKGDPAPDPKKEPEKKTEPTEDEKFAERLKAERLKWENDQRAKADKERAAAEKKKAEEEGKFKELADAAEKRALDAEAKALAAERAALINDTFAEVAADSKDGVTLKALCEWVKPKVMAGLTPESDADEVRKQAKALAEQYAKDVAGAKPKGNSGAPIGPTRITKPNPAPQNNERPARRFAHLNYRA